METMLLSIQIPTLTLTDGLTPTHGEEKHHQERNFNS